MIGARLHAAVLVFLLGFWLTAAAEPLPLPAGARSGAVGDEVILNGTPMHIRPFTVARSQAEVAAHFRRALGARAIETRVGDATIFGRPDGTGFLTVELRPSPGGGVRGFVSRSAAPVAAASAGDGGLLPPGSRVLSRMDSRDGAARSRHLVGLNHGDVDANAAFVVDRLRRQGFTLERQEAGDSGTALLFEGRRREAIAVVARHGERTVVVINLVHRDP